MSKSTAHESAKLIKRVTLLSVIVAIVIIALKLLAWFFTDSLSLLSSLLDSVMDVLASLLSFVAARYALMPADDDHRFGHGKAEDIAALAQATFIAGSGVFIFIEGVSRILHPQAVTHQWLGIAVMLMSTLLILGLLSYQRYVIEKTGSVIVKADAAHYQTDLMINGLVVVSFLIVGYFEVYFLDAALALFIATYVLKAAWQIGVEAFDKLMDKELSDQQRQMILDVVLAHKVIKGVHDLRTRVSGANLFIQFHLEMDGAMKLQNAHDIMEEVESSLLKHFTHAEILIHADPYTEKEISLELGHVLPTNQP